MKYILAFVFAVFSTPVFASTTAQTLLFEGDYASAYQAGLAADTVEGLNIAARVMAAEIMLVQVDDPKDHAKAAIELMDKALEMDPGNIEATFMRALHTGFRTRNTSAVTVFINGLAGKTREAIEAFEALSPDDGRADALHGAWHLGIIHAAGGPQFGASLEEGFERYEMAVFRRPTDVIVLSNYAYSLIQLDEPVLRPRALQLLQQIEALSLEDATEKETQRRMVSLLEVFDDEDALLDRAEGLLNTESKE